jgi:hypothetical protein
VSGYRAEIEAFAGPSREGLIGGGARLLVRVRMFDDNPEGPPAPDALCDLRPETARELAFCLLAAAQDADRQTDQAAFWEQTR